MASASATVPGPGGIAIPGAPIVARRRLPVPGGTSTMLAAAGDGAPIMHPGKMPPRLPWPDIGHLGKWSVSSYKFGFGPECLTDEDPDTFWHSDGPQPHFISVEFPRKVAIQKISMYLSFPLDDSYTPSTIAVRAGTGNLDLQDVRILSIEKPDGWITFDVCLEPNEDGDGFKSVDAHMIQVIIVNNHMNGKDTHVRGLKILGPIENKLRSYEEPFPFVNPQFRVFQGIR
ncbi:APC10-domain-containing protein [Earliella scabrosa]|nr:APC10-domain-containing protein [Earliella scabrosa]